MDYSKLGKRVRNRRMALNWTQEYLAREIGVSTSFIGHIERGSRKASIDTLVQLANAMQVSTDALLSDSLEQKTLDSVGIVKIPTSSQRNVMKQVLTTLQEQIEFWNDTEEN